MIVDKLILDSLEEQGLITRSENNGLTICKYTNKCKDFDDLLKKMRSFVYETETGVVVTYGHDKIFNYFDQNPFKDETVFEVYEKLDGVFIQIFWHNEKIIIASMGTIGGEFAKKAEQLIRNECLKYSSLLNKIKGLGISLLMEMIGPSSHIVIDYEKDELVLTGTRKLYTLENGSHEFNKFLLSSNEVRYPQSEIFFRDELIRKLKDQEFSNKEGYVFTSGNKGVKFKYDKYFEVASIKMITLKKMIGMLFSKNDHDMEIDSEIVEDVSKKMSLLREITEDELVSHKRIIEGLSTEKTVHEQVLEYKDNDNVCVALLFAIYHHKDNSTIESIIKKHLTHLSDKGILDKLMLDKKI